MSECALNKAIELAEELGEFYKEDDWLVVKKYLLKYLNSSYRKLFSKRNSKNKKHAINDFELKVIDHYYNKFNIRLKLNEDKKL
tara:strand:+ start:11741 stop:11992 length:252 start_codon:yes stop_codon:yes gene_type:complete